MNDEEIPMEIGLSFKFQPGLATTVFQAEESLSRMSPLPRVGLSSGWQRAVGGTSIANCQLLFANFIYDNLDLNPGQAMLVSFIS